MVVAKYRDFKINSEFYRTHVQFQGTVKRKNWCLWQMRRTNSHGSKTRDLR